jgi:hypothetical protein
MHRIPVTHATLEGKSRRSSHLCAAKSKLQTGKNCEEMHYNVAYYRKCDIGLCIEQCFEVYHSKLNYLE